ncbi:N-acetyltransferase [Brevibacillus reuszeri]|uniref:Acetyltransferase n=1 Tax=Brevibacillus reuszeri TaxID=54915 RepID=A0A0K9YW85_9BACL|nr:GNAT family protein [Brevibacillus reuszeri]KNB72994.1 acetyltransferase [Brevibacillus reuszeri]MED1861053.1 GNAT family protein [Brevibacillus reuszeri]GED72882.1 N-acetyltransferase [Brevibacillus reuszeri]
MNFHLMTTTDAHEIVSWKYPEEYSFYNFDDSEETFAELLDGTYYAVRDQDEPLIGFFCYGRNAQVPEGRNQHQYTGDNILDIGLGMMPELTGKGLGLTFLQAGIDFAIQQYQPAYLRLSVAAFNIRATKVYSKMGFAQTGAFVNNGTAFIVMKMKVELG